MFVEGNMSGGFVGRPAELDELQKCAARAKGGDPQLVFVEGVPGIGKTSLLTQFASTLSGWRQIVDHDRSNRVGR